MAHQAKSKYYSECSAVVHHADGTSTNLGVISSNVPFWVRLLRRIKKHGQR